MGITIDNEKPEYRKTQAIFGNTTVGFVIPRRFAENLNIEKGDYLRIVQSGPKLVVEKAEDV